MIQILRAPAPGRNPPLCRLEYVDGAPLLEASDDVSKRRNAAWAAGGEVRSDYRDAEANATALLVARLEQLKREMTVALVGASDFRRFQLNALLADVDRLLQSARADLEQIARQAYSQGAALGTAHAEQPIEAAGFKVTLPSGLDPVLVTHAFENTADLLTETMQQFRSRVTTNVRRIAVSGDSFASGMLELSRDIGLAGLDNAAYRAERIVRTELGRTFNGATFARLLELAERVPALRKIWIRTRDSRTRDTHADAGNRYARGKGIAIAEYFTVGPVLMRFPIDPLAEPPGKQAARETIMCRCNAATDFDPVQLAAETAERVRLAVGGATPDPVLPPAPEPPAPKPAPKPRAPRVPKPKTPKPFDPAKVRAKLIAHFNQRRDERGELWLKVDQARTEIDTVRGALYNSGITVGPARRAELLQRIRDAEDRYRKLSDEASKHSRDTETMARKILAVPAADRTKYRLTFARIPGATALTAADKKRYAEALKAFESFVGLKSTGEKWGGYKNGEIVVRIDDANTRASISDLSRFGSRHQMNARDTTSARTIVHELAHTLEFDDPRVLRASLDFIARRTAGESYQKLSKITGNTFYKDDEIAKPDKFISPYIGKDYGGQATEVISMGVEHLYAEPERLAREDPDYFDFMLRVLRGIF